MSYKPPSAAQIKEALNLVNWPSVLLGYTKEDSEFFAELEGDKRLHLRLPYKNDKQLTVSISGSNFSRSDVFPYFTGNAEIFEFWQWDFPNSKYDYLFSIIPAKPITAESAFKSFIDSYSPETDSINVDSLSNALGLTSSQELAGYIIKTSVETAKEGQSITIEIAPSPSAKPLNKAYLVLKGRKGSNLTRKDFENAKELGFGSSLATRITLDGKNSNFITLKIAQESNDKESDYENAIIGLFSSARYNSNWDSQQDQYQVAKPIKFRIENIRRTPATPIKPAKIYNRIFPLDQAGAKQSTIDFIRADLNNKEVKNFRIKDWNNERDSGYFTLDGIRIGEKHVVSNPAPFVGETLSATELKKLAWVPGKRGSIDTIEIFTDDIYGNTVNGEKGEWRTTELQPLNVKNKAFSFKQAGLPQKVSDYIDGSFENDAITNFKILEYQPSDDSGFFTLNGRRLIGEEFGEKQGTKVHVHTFLPEQFKNLYWNPGEAGTEDPIMVFVQDRYGAFESGKEGVWSTVYGSTNYKLGLKNGYKHVTEGNALELIITKDSNTRKQTELEYCVGSLDGTPSDLEDRKLDKWQTLTFQKNEKSKSISIKTLQDFRPEGSEFMRFFILNRELDNGKSWESNPAYSWIDFGIHDKPYYGMPAKVVKSIAEGESHTVKIARFGGYKEASTATLKVEALTSRYKGLEHREGMAQAADFEAESKKYTFSQDYDYGGSLNKKGILEAEVKAMKDKSPELVETLTWTLYQQKNNKLVPIESKQGLINITDRPSGYTLQSGWDAGAAVQGFITGLGNWFMGLLGSTPAVNSEVLKFNRQLGSKKTARLPDNVSTLLTPVNSNGKSGLIGVDGGTLIGVDGGTLIGVDGGTLIGPDGGTFMPLNGGFLAPPSNVYSSLALSSLQSLPVANPLIAAGGLN